MKPNANVLEINAMVLCDRLSKKKGGALPSLGGTPRQVLPAPGNRNAAATGILEREKTVALTDIPSAEWEALAEQGFDALWLMGVWQRGPSAEQRDSTDPTLRAVYNAAVPGWQPHDVFGSPYAIYSYTLDNRLGGSDGLNAVKHAVNEAGLSLILDFVPNHMSIEHPWVKEHPGYFVRGTEEQLSSDPDIFFHAGEERYLAHGKDPYFPSWKDTVQINYFSAQAREAMIQQLLSIARYADGVRCDMAMLIISRVFAQTWGKFVGPAPRAEFWREAIARVKQVYPGFFFIAEAYWDLEWELQQLGFDFTYDKRLYDRLIRGHVPDIAGHLQADRQYQARSLRFIENHDEPRAVTAFGRERSFAAAAAMANVPGLHLYFDGQKNGSRVHQPVQMVKEPHEVPDQESEIFYARLLQYTHSPVFAEGCWSPGKAVQAWNGNGSNGNLLVFLWVRENRLAKLIVVNYAACPSQGRVPVPWELLPADSVMLHDAFSGVGYLRYREELATPGLYVALAPWQSHLFDITS